MNSLIEQAVKHFDKKREQVLGWADAVETVEVCAKAFPELLPTISLGYTNMSLQGILLHLHVADMEKDMVPVLRFLARAGYPKRGAPVDYAEIGRRTWSCDGDIQVLVFIRDDENTVCEFVEVGVKEEKVYELQCTKKVAV